MASHAIARAKQRYRVSLTDPDLAQLALKIELGEARFVQAGASETTAIYWVWCSAIGCEIPLVYDYAKEIIVTILGEDYAQANPGKRRPKAPRRRPAALKQFEVDADTLTAEPMEGDLPTERAENNALAEALKKALTDAGLLTGPSPSLR